MHRTLGHDLTNTKTYTVYITEINRGYAEFDTKEDAEAFANDGDRDYDLVKWINSEISAVNVVNAEITQLLIESPD